MKGTPASLVTRFSFSAVFSTWVCDSMTQGPAIKAMGFPAPIFIFPTCTGFVFFIFMPMGQLPFSFGEKFNFEGKEFESKMKYQIIGTSINYLISYMVVSHSISKITFYKSKKM